MDALGGNKGTARITGSKYNAAANWRSKGRFPAKTYIDITRALAEQGYTAPASLWGMDDAGQRVSA
jgi:hypothetical protein